MHGLLFHLEKGWHIYWENPRDSGEPPRVRCQLPPRVSIVAIEWLAPGKQGYATECEENSHLDKIHTAPTAALLDPSDEIGRLFDAKSSPQIVVINPQGMVIYSRAIDDRPTTDLSDVNGATNYVCLALEQSMAGKPVQTSATRPYGCSVKHANLQTSTTRSLVLGWRYFFSFSGFCIRPSTSGRTRLVARSSCSCGPSFSSTLATTSSTLGCACAGCAGAAEADSVGAGETATDGPGSGGLSAA